MSGEFDTNFISENEKNLLAPGRVLSRSRLGTIALVKVWLETLEYRTKRVTEEDPWGTRDNFRVNHRPNRDLTLLDEDGTKMTYLVQYLNENCFNVYYRNAEDHMEPVTLNARVSMSQLDANQVVVADDHHKYLVNFSFDPLTNTATQLDYES
jgi:hypothetical protein